MASKEVRKTPTSAKDTPVLLMSIIKTLSSSAAFKEREKEKANLEKSYKETDKKLDGLLNDHMTDLTQIMQAFSTVNASITDSRERIRAIKGSLQSCKNLLHCKRDELKKLWIEGIEQKTMVAMLDQIEEVRQVSGKLPSLIEKKHYLHVTQLLESAISKLEGPLKEVDALREVKAELYAKKEELYEVLIEELHKQIYIKSTQGVVKGFQRQGSQRQSGKKEKDKQNLGKSLMISQTQQNKTQSVAEENLKALESVSLEEVADPKQTITELLNVSAEDNTVHFISILVESLSLLHRLPEAIDATRTRIRPGLLAIIQRSSQQVSDNAYLEGEEISTLQQPQYLLELMELVFQQFRVVARTHQIVLANLQRVKAAKKALNQVCLYDTSEVWMKIQAVLQVFLSDYLDLRNTTPSAQSQADAGFEQHPMDMAVYFSKKKSNRPKKFSLFRFDSSSHAISMNSYLREQRQDLYGSGELLTHEDNQGDVAKSMFVCKPCSNNITVVYNPLMNFIKEIEAATGLQKGALRVFIHEYVENIYLGSIMTNIKHAIDASTKGADTPKLVISQRTQKELGVAKPLLQSTVSVSERIKELQNLMKDLPDYGEQFLTMICKILQDYLASCQSSYRGIVSSEAEDKRIISAMWAKDEDISRLLMCLPNWRRLKEIQDSDEEISEEDMRAMNSKESSILTSNLAGIDSLIPNSEIISEKDTSLMRTLGNLCESLEWFALHIRGFASTLSTSPLGMPGHGTQVSASTKESLLHLSDEFEILSEECLLVLHLEVRVHCFYHLMPVAKQSNYSGAIDDMDPDSNVIKLNKDIASIEEAMGQSLQPKKYRYIFEGLGHLVSTILINSTQYLKKINENGIKKMCRNIFAVQQSLTNITMNRESDLDHARQYYELLYLSPEEVLNVIMERGPQFTEQEYSNLLQLAHRSARQEETSDTHLQKLKDILTEFENML